MRDEEIFIFFRYIKICPIRLLYPHQKVRLWSINVLIIFRSLASRYLMLKTTDEIWLVQSNFIHSSKKEMVALTVYRVVVQNAYLKRLGQFYSHSPRQAESKRGYWCEYTLRKI